MRGLAMSVEGLFLTIFMLVVVSAFVAMAVRKWLQEFFLRFIGYTTYTTCAFLAAALVKLLFYDWQGWEASVLAVAGQLRDGDEVHELLILVATGVGFIAAARKIDEQPRR